MLDLTQEVHKPRGAKATGTGMSSKAKPSLKPNLRKQTQVDTSTLPSRVRHVSRTPALDPVPEVAESFIEAVVVEHKHGPQEVVQRGYSSMEMVTDDDSHPRSRDADHQQGSSTDIPADVKHGQQEVVQRGNSSVEMVTDDDSHPRSRDADHQQGSSTDIPADVKQVPKVAQNDSGPVDMVTDDNSRSVAIEAIPKQDLSTDKAAEDDLFSDQHLSTDDVVMELGDDAIDCDGGYEDCQGMFTRYHPRLTWFWEDGNSAPESSWTKCFKAKRDLVLSLSPRLNMGYRLNKAKDPPSRKLVACGEDISSNYRVFDDSHHPIDTLLKLDDVHWT